MNRKCLFHSRESKTRAIFFLQQYQNTISLENDFCLIWREAIFDSSFLKCERKRFPLKTSFLKIIIFIQFSSPLYAESWNFFYVQFWITFVKFNSFGSQEECSKIGKEKLLFFLLFIKWPLLLPLTSNNSREEKERRKLLETTWKIFENNFRKFNAVENNNLEEWYFWKKVEDIA